MGACQKRRLIAVLLKVKRSSWRRLYGKLVRAHVHARDAPLKPLGKVGVVYTLLPALKTAASAVFYGKPHVRPVAAKPHMPAFDGVAQSAGCYQIYFTVVSALLVDVIDFVSVTKLTVAISAPGQLAHAHQIFAAAGQATLHVVCWSLRGVWRCAVLKL